VHASCRKAFNRTEELKKIQHMNGAEQNVQKRKTRADTGGFDYMEMCLLCGEVCLQDDRNKAKRRKVAMHKTEVTLNEACDKRGNDEWAREVKGRLAFCNDLMAVDAVYHTKCNVRFKKCLPNQQETFGKEGL
jgi:hypothetical protein